MKKYMKLFIIIVLAMYIVGCTKYKQADTEQLSSIKPNLTYFQDIYGICYAQATSVVRDSNIIVSITAVPCEKLNNLPLQQSK